MTEILSLVQSVEHTRLHFLRLSDVTIPQMWWGATLGLNDSLATPYERSELEALIVRLRSNAYALPGVRPFLVVGSIARERNARDFFLLLSFLCATGKIIHPETHIASILERAHASLVDSHSYYLSPEHTSETLASGSRSLLRGSFIETSRAEEVQISDDVFVLRITSFASFRVIPEVGEAIKRIQVAHENPHIIVDLRNNGGGFVHIVAAVAGHFFRNGPVFLRVDKNGQETFVEAPRSGPTLKAASTTVLVNGNTASAAEILTAALRERGASVIGEQTYGKGTAQLGVLLENGGSSWISSYRVYSPSGVSWQGVGITPDESVSELLLRTDVAILDEMQSWSGSAPTDVGIIAGLYHVRSHR